MNTEILNNNTNNLITMEDLFPNNESQKVVVKFENLSDQEPEYLVCEPEQSTGILYDHNSQDCDHNPEENSIVNVSNIKKNSDYTLQQTIIKLRHKIKHEYLDDADRGHSEMLCEQSDSSQSSDKFITLEDIPKNVKGKSQAKKSANQMKANRNTNRTYKNKWNQPLVFVDCESSLGAAKKSKTPRKRKPTSISDSPNNKQSRAKLKKGRKRDMSSCSPSSVYPDIPSAAGSSNQLDTNDITLENTADDINLILEISDIDDCDLNEICPLLLPVNQGAPTCPADLSPIESQVLQIEDELNDRHIREIAPEDFCDFKWTTDEVTFTGQRETFKETAGLTFPVTEQLTDTDVFYKMFDSDFWDLLCTETNRCAVQKIASLKAHNQLTPNSLLHYWTPTDRDEMVSFVAIMILQGHYQLQDEKSYFTFNGFGTMPYFSRIMSYNRFVLLKSFCHFVDNDSLKDDSDRETKIRPLLEYFNDKFSTLYMPSQDIVIDESPFKCLDRLNYSQKITAKTDPAWMKTYELSEASTGYVWKFIMCVGKKRTQPDQPSNGATQPTNGSTRPTNGPADEFSSINASGVTNHIGAIDDDVTIGSIARPKTATTKIILDLMKPLLHRGYTLIMDNFYNSPLLLRYLKAQQTDCYGTIRLDREFVPPMLVNFNKSYLKQREAVTSYCSDLSMMVWKDANFVSMISTYHKLEERKWQDNKLTYPPQIVSDYNNSMGGVQRRYQFLSAHPMGRPHNKVWYMNVFCRILNVAMFNCFVIYASRNENVAQDQFRIKLAENLLRIHKRIDMTTEQRILTYQAGDGSAAYAVYRGYRPSKRPEIQTHDHFPVKNGKRKGRCVLCHNERKVDARTVWKCMECNVNLCIEICFREYHK
ncbi:piggyBac transposable element-derived protein 4-like [Galleria mellonella]|uniref:PiggyBac transposable element-derived protein 4-like n=1 Tax=Galleria mellonella TaxID=7137 RepID=A0A6J1WK03_GALME|nr:piggyBac transposable element-derived protein 4-like [Galleria mellonella]